MESDSSTLKLEKTLNEISKKGNVTVDELRTKIKEKQSAFSGMLTEEGAAHLVAKDLGVNLLNGGTRRFQMKNIVAGMKNVNAMGRVFKISGVVDFTRNGSPGKVVNLFVGDSTAFVRLPLWNDQVKLIEDGEIKLGDIIKIMNAYARESMMGGVELSVGKYGRLDRADDDEGEVKMPEVDAMVKMYLMQRDDRTPINKLVPGNFELRATMVHIFRGSFVYYTCPECGRSAKPSDGKYVCKDHGEVDAQPAMVMSGVIDDSTGTIRATFFRDVAEMLCGVSAADIDKMDREQRYEAVANNCLGKELIVQGRVQKNQMFDRMEIIANSFKDINISEESERLVDDLNLKVGM